VKEKADLADFVLWPREDGHQALEIAPSLEWDTKRALLAMPEMTTTQGAHLGCSNGGERSRESPCTHLAITSHSPRSRGSLAKAASLGECQGEVGVVCLLFAAKIRKALDELDVEVNPSDNIKDPCTLQLGTVLERFLAPGSP
jgi:hypothetical protein